jgi:hypothetical protein
MSIDPRQPGRLDSTNIAAGPPPEPPATKTKIADRLDKVVNEAPPTRNRSPELIPLTHSYEKLKKNLRVLVASVKKYADTTGRVQAARDEVSRWSSKQKEKER